MKTGIILFVLLSISLAACLKAPSVDELIQEELEKRIEVFKEQKRKECQDLIILEAENLVDSIMYLEIGSTLKNTLKVPDKPERSGDSLAYEIELDTTSFDTFWMDSIDIH